MKKINMKAILLVCVLILGAAGAAIRAVELAAFIDPITNLYNGTGTIVYALPIITVVACILSVLCAFMLKDKVAESFFEAYAVKSKLNLFILVISAFLLIISGALKIIAVTRNLSVAQLIYGIITVICGISMYQLARVRYNKKTNEFTRLLATIPIFWACFLVMLTFMEHPVEPVMQIFAYDLLGSCALVLAVYYTSALLFGKMKLFLPAASSLLALYFIMVTVGGRVLAFAATMETRFLTETPFRMLVFAAMFMYVAVNTVSLLNCKTKE